jgi:alkyl hydroperoxide reductase subunit AhpC/predicted Ser/Thr protein kinase
MAHVPTLLGSLAPPFDLPCTQIPDPSRCRAALSDYRGRWLILIFYPRDFSLVCPTELISLSGKVEEFRRHGCDLLGISCDALESHERWITTPRSRGGLGGLNFPLASDEDGAAARAYGVYLEYQHAALRGLFIIDPNGVLQYQVVHNLSVGRRSDEVLRVLNALQTGGLCGENWSAPGDTIEPTAVLVPNSVVSHYRIEAEVGSGTFAKVYRARDLLLDRSVALKVLKRDSPMAPGTVLAEARAAAALGHPNVCTIFAVDDSLGVPVITMEYLRGRPLSQILVETSAPLDLEQAASLGRQIALGMAAAHDLGIVHGDLKPENVMISGDGVAKILDFGLSRRQARPGAPDETLVMDGAEIGSGLVGTPSYMAPEQTTGEPASKASDVFALGVILFEMLAGRRAFPSKNLLQVLDQIRRVDAEALASEVPEPLAPILRLALARDPDDRTITMRQIAEWLGASLQPANAR